MAKKKNPFIGQSIDAYHRENMKDPEYAAAFEAEYSRRQIAAQIRAAREAAEMTQLELALAVGTKQPAIARLERGAGHPRLELLQKIGHATGRPLFVG
ncbi:MAG: helix-turn-helix transcriptional regulator, partial [Gammaproteobacteria bacterium]